MEKIRELLSRLKDLAPDELAELRSLVVDEFTKLDAEETTSENVAMMNELAEAGEQAMAEQTTRDEAQAQAEADRQTARDRISALNPEEKEEAPEDPEAKEDPKPEADGDKADAKDTTPAEPVAASGAVRRMAARSPKPTLSPEAAPETSPGISLVATGNLRSSNVGQKLNDRMELAEAICETLDHMPRQGSPRGNVVVASARWKYPDERILGNDAMENTRKLEMALHPDALVATGGVCLPVNVDYAVPTWATAERPIRDALPSYQASRGGVRYVQPPDIAGASGLGAGGGLTSATGLWSEATDASPGAATKPIVSIACGSEQLVYVGAVSTRLGFGNMQSRFAPEQIAANTDLAIAAAAHVAEVNLLNLIAGSCVQTVTAPHASTGLGASRDLKTLLHGAIAAYKDAHRLSDSQKFTLLAPRWLRDLFKIDIAREIGHSQNSEWNAFTISDAQVDEVIGSAGAINPVYFLDGQPTSSPGLGSSVNQYFGIQAGGALALFPTQVVFYLYPDGFFQFLDGGRLDLGVVRDSTLDATNDFETMVETFEGIAYRGFANGALQIVATLSAIGATAATVTVSATS